jgi:hypothetical protein
MLYYCGLSSLEFVFWMTDLVVRIEICLRRIHIRLSFQLVITTTDTELLPS